MNVFELIETLSLERNNLTDQMRVQISNQISAKDLVRASRYLTENLDPSHQIPSKELETFWGIIDWYREFDDLTKRQKYFLSTGLINNWQYLTPEAHSRLMV